MVRRHSGPARRRRRDSHTVQGPVKTPRPAVDGKVNVFCPQCSAEYRIPGEDMDNRIRCRHCQRVFSPRATLGARRRPQPGALTFIWATVGAVALIGLGVLIKSLATPTPVTNRVAQQQPSIGPSNPRVQAVRRWVDAVAAGNSFGIEYGADLAALVKFLEIPTERSYHNAFPDERRELTAKVREVLATGERARVLREFEMTTGQLQNRTMLNSAQGRVLIDLQPRDPHKYRGNATVAIDFTMEGVKPGVTGWEVQFAPHVVETARDLPQQSAGSDAVGPHGVGTAEQRGHPEIALPRSSHTTFRGKEVLILESELVPLSHLADTDPLLRAEVDRLIGDLLDLDGPGALANRSIQRLSQIGRAAIPRLLNQFHELSSDLEANNLKLTRVDRALRVMTGRAFEYEPGSHLTQREELEEQRLSALKQWYAWWYRNHDRDSALIDRQENPSPAKRKTPPRGGRR